MYSMFFSRMDSDILVLYMRTMFINLFTKFTTQTIQTGAVTIYQKRRVVLFNTLLQDFQVHRRSAMSRQDNPLSTQNMSCVVVLQSGLSFVEKNTSAEMFFTC